MFPLLLTLSPPTRRDLETGGSATPHLTAVPSCAAVRAALHSMVIVITADHTPLETDKLRGPHWQHSIFGFAKLRQDVEGGRGKKRKGGVVGFRAAVVCMQW